MNKKRLGKLGEAFVKHYLLIKGWQIIYMNYLVNRYGEIDIIAINGADINFVEVKTRSTSESDKIYGSAKDAVDKRKLTRLHNAINYFLSHEGKTYQYYNKKISVVTVDVGYIEVEEM